jgi:hypothetical protein
MKIQEYIKYINLYNFKIYIDLYIKIKEDIFNELLYTNFINTKETYIKQIEEIKFNKNNILEFFNLIRHIFLYKFIIINLTFNSNLNKIFNHRIKNDLIDRNKFIQLIYLINNNSNESFSFDKNFTIKKKRYILLNNKLYNFFNILNNKYKISKKSSENIYIYYNNGTINKYNFKYISEETNINNFAKNDIKYIIKFNRIIIKNYSIIIKLDFDLIIYYNINNINNINTTLYNNDYYIYPNILCKIKYIDDFCNNYLNLIHNNSILYNIPNYISKLIISNFFIKEIDYNNWFRDNYNLNFMEDTIINNKLITENNFENNNFENNNFENNNFENNNFKSIKKYFYILYFLLFIIICIDIIQIIFILYK